MNSSVSSAERSGLSPALPGSLGIIMALVCNWIWPWPIAPYIVVLPAGVVFIVLVILMAIWLTRAFERHGTSSDPSRETTAIIDTGPYKYSRNPAYIAFSMLMVTIGLLVNNVWILLMIVPVMIIIHYVIVLREESYLEAKFGDIYRSYKLRVRRWI